MHDSEFSWPEHGAMIILTHGLLLCPRYVVGGIINEWDEEDMERGWLG